MEKIIWQYLIYITTFLSGTVLALSKKIAEEFPKYKKIDSLRIRAIAAALIILVNIIGTVRIETINSNTQIIKDSLNQLKLNEKDSIFRMELATRDKKHENREDSLSSAYQSKVDSSYEKSLKASNSALAKYNLILIDSLNKVAQKINIKSRGMPQVMVSPVIGKLPSIYYFLDSDGRKLVNVRFRSTQSTAYNVNIAYYIIKIDSLKLKEVLQYDRLISGQFIVSDELVFKTVSFQFSDKLLNEKGLMLVLIGNFSRDPLGLEILPYKQVFTINFRKDNIDYGQADNINYKNIETFLSKRNLLIY